MAGSFEPIERPTIFRKMAAAMWGTANDPTVYGTMDVDATPARTFMEAVREEHGIRLTYTHLVSRAVALALAKHPELNARVRFWGKLERRSQVDLFIQVASEDGNDLSGARIENADHLGVLELARVLRERAQQIRSNTDQRFRGSRSLIGRLPWWLVRPMLSVSDLMVNDLNLDLAGQGLPRDPFGSAMVTSVARYGIDTGFSPLAPVARCPLVVLIPQVRDRPWVVNGGIEVRPVLRLCGSFDHRIIDGAHAGLLASEIGELLMKPEALG